MAIEYEEIIVVEQHPIRGIEPTVKFFDTLAEARAYAEPRQKLFARIDVAEVRFRSLTQVQYLSEVQT